MAKPKVSRTFGPIHFEDLDPHRFEDLVRELLYDFRDWQSIEATGRSGDDAGFDIRAYEKTVSANDNVEDEELTSQFHPMDGNMWKVQCKREHAIGPSKVSSIINDGVSFANPPYGYILVASANFSKKSYDIFREELRKKGVMEFYLWGKAELEDMLHMPKYDRILFTFFGISLVSARRSKITGIKSFVQLKNKVMKTFGDDPKGKDVLIRNVDDIHYPRTEKYSDFNACPRWKAFRIQAYNVTGFYVEVSDHIAYFDELTLEWDYAESLDLNMLGYDEENEAQTKKAV